MEIAPMINAYVTAEEAYQAGDIIIEEGARGDWAFIVLEGQVKVTKRTALGMLKLDVLKKGAVFGEMAVFGTTIEGRSASVVAADNEARVGALDTQRLIEEYQSMSPELRSVIRALVMELRQLNEKAAALVVAANEKPER